MCIYDQIHKLMKITQNKEQYISPVCEVEETELEGVIAASAPDLGGGGEYTLP